MWVLQRQKDGEMNRGFERGGRKWGLAWWLRDLWSYMPWTTGEGCKQNPGAKRYGAVSNVLERECVIARFSTEVICTLQLALLTTLVNHASDSSTEMDFTPNLDSLPSTPKPPPISHMHQQDLCSATSTHTQSLMSPLTPNPLHRSPRSSSSSPWDSRAPDCSHR